MTSCVSSTLGFYCVQKSTRDLTWTQNTSETEAPPEVRVLSETQGLLASCFLCFQDIDSTIFVNAWRFRWGKWKTTEYKLRPYNALTEFYLPAFYVIISWFTATEEFWLVHFRITTCWYERYFEVKLKWAFIGVIVIILCSFLYALLFYIDHVNTNSILYSVMKDDFMSRYSKKSVPGSY